VHEAFHMARNFSVWDCLLGRMDAFGVGHEVARRRAAAGFHAFSAAFRSVDTVLSASVDRLFRSFEFPKVRHVRAVVAFCGDYVGGSSDCIVRGDDSLRASVVAHEDESMTMTPPNHALQRTRHGVVVCNPRVPCAGSLSLGR
jgi:hypothetical protein